jgi:predicted MFS family arabinose efflux permease
MSSKAPNVAEFPPRTGFGDPAVARYAWIVLGVLALVNSLNFMDRWAISVLIETIKHDLKLSDTELGLVSGLAFALGYAAFSLPIARIADLGSRRNVLIASLTIWSVMTGVTGLAQNFWQLMLARLGVGVGESGCIPTCQSLVTDYFPPEKRPFALSIVSSGLMVGKVLGIGGAGLLVGIVGWQHTLMLLALPGPLVAVLIWFVVKEPPKGRYEQMKDDAPRLAAWPAFRTLFKTKSYWTIVVALAFSNFVIVGMQNWSPAFYVRTYGLTPAQVGAAIATTVGIGGAVGLIGGGFITQALMKRDPRWATIAAVICHLVAGICVISSLLVTDAHISLTLFAMTAVILSLPTGGVFATQLNAVDPRARSTAAAFSSMLTSIVGAGLGPLVVGALSDLMTPQFGANGLRYALILIASLHVLPALFYGLATRALPGELKRAKAIS